MKIGHRQTPLFYFEFQAPNRFKTTTLDGTERDLLCEKRDGKVWVRSGEATRPHGSALIYIGATSAARSL
jgi:hypothetical protein